MLRKSRSNGKQEVGVHLWLHDVSGGTCLKASLYELKVSMKPLRKRPLPDCQIPSNS